MTGPITLTEYERRTVALDGGAARALVAAAGDRLRVGASTEPGEYRLEATQHVGSIVVPGATVLIRPKVALENLFVMLEVGEPDWRPHDFTWDTAGGLLPAFAAFFARSVERMIGPGLLYAYREEHDLLPALRGRFDVAAQFRRQGVAVPIPCRYEEFTADVAENRVLRAALRRLAVTPGVPPLVHRRLLHLLARLDGVADVYVDPDLVDRLHFTRLNERYRPALRLAQLVLRDVTLADRAGARTASSFLIDMNALFQDFVTARLQRLLRGRLEVLAEPKGYRLGEANRVVLRPDLVFRRGGRDVFVADVKYKLLGDDLARNPDYYQLLAYTTAMDLPEGALIYCSADSGAPDQVITVKHAGKRLWAYHLDLGNSAANVAQEFARLSAVVWHRLASPADTVRSSPSLRPW